MLAITLGLFEATLISGDAIGDRLKLSRHRRWVYPGNSGWTATFKGTLKMPIEDSSSSLSLAIPFTYSFDSGTASGRKKRSFNGHESQRLSAIKQAETLVALATNLDGHECMLRIMCEAAHTPTHGDGLIGDAINALLLPVHLLDLIPEQGESEYVRAQRMGHHSGDCSYYHATCPMSIFQVVEQPVKLCKDTLASSSMNNATLARVADHNPFSYSKVFGFEDQRIDVLAQVS